LPEPAMMKPKLAEAPPGLPGAEIL
jgi:hypothetical protein